MTAGRDEQPQEQNARRRKPVSDPGRREQIERMLDDALADTFPASDPVSIMSESEHDRERRESESRH
jgi:hypothetical protein